MYSQDTYIMQQEWAKTYSAQDSIYNSATAIDANGNVYVTGFTYNAITNQDITTIKYDLAGNQLWVMNYNGPINGADRAVGMAIDNNGSIFVAGVSKGLTNNNDYVLIKYKPDGSQAWVQRYDNGGHDNPKDIKVDNQGNIYLCGNTFGASTYDFYVIKYDSDGNMLWENGYDNGGNDEAISLFIDENDFVYITGNTYSSGSLYDIIIRKLDSAGTVLWTVFKDNGNSSDLASDIVVDDFGNVIVTGYTRVSGSEDFYTCKLDNNGAEIWSEIYDAYGFRDVAVSMALDSDGDIYVTGETKTQNNQVFKTLKYSSIDGSKIWEQNYYTATADKNSPIKILCDFEDNIYVCGVASNGINQDYITVKYNNQGIELWQDIFNGDANGNDSPSDIIATNDGSLYITGQSYNGSNYDFATIKYSRRDILIPPDTIDDPASDFLVYYQNKGQLVNTNIEPVDEIKFYTKDIYPTIFIANDFHSYVFSKFDSTGNHKDSLSRFDIRLADSNPTQIFWFDASNEYLNYFLGHVPEGRANIKGYKRLVKPNAYDKIDFHYFSNTFGGKFYFVVNPGGRPSEIKMEVDGHDSLYVTSDGGLVIETDFGNVEYKKALVFRINPSGNMVPMPSSGSFSILGTNKVHFNIENYPSTMPLIIAFYEETDLASPPPIPGNLEWSTYHTGANYNYEDMGYGLCNDYNGNLYVAGKTSKPDFPFQVGYYDYMGLHDIFVSKFDVNASLDWSTFYGGKGDDEALDIAFNGYNNGFLYFTGKTSSIDFPINPAVNPGNGVYYQETGYGDEWYSKYNAYLVKMNLQGSPLWSTYFGGNGESLEHELGRSIVCDNSGNVFLTGNTQTSLVGDNDCLAPSNGGFPVCNAAFPNHSGGQDIFVAKFNFENQLQFSTFFGGSGNDVVYDIEIIETASEPEIFITGSTTTPNIPLLNTSDDFYSEEGYFISGKEAFISSFSLIGALTWSTLFPGVIEFQSLTKHEDDNQLYAVGYTNAATGISSCESVSGMLPICNYYGDYFIQSENNGENDLFITCFENHKLTWSTFFGGSTNEYSSIPEFAGLDEKYIDAKTDANGNLFVMGITEKHDDPEYSFVLESYDDYYFQNQNKGVATSVDISISGFTNNHQFYWSTLFGGGDNDNMSPDYNSDFGTALAVFTNKLFLTGYSYTYNYPYQCPGGTDPYCFNSPEWMFFPACVISRFGINLEVGSEELKLYNNDITIFPNPTNNYLRFSVAPENNTVAEIYDILGKRTERVKLLDNNIDVSSYSPGTYFLRVISGNETKTYKFLKF